MVVDDMCQSRSLGESSTGRSPGRPTCGIVSRSDEVSTLKPVGPCPNSARRRRGFTLRLRRPTQRSQKVQTRSLPQRNVDERHRLCIGQHATCGCICCTALLFLQRKSDSENVVSRGDTQDSFRTSGRATNTAASICQNTKKVHWAIEECIVIPITPRSVSNVPTPISEVDVLRNALAAKGSNEYTKDWMSEVEILQAAMATTNHNDSTYELVHTMDHENDAHRVSASKDVDDEEATEPDNIALVNSARVQHGHRMWLDVASDLHLEKDTCLLATWNPHKHRIAQPLCVKPDQRGPLFHRQRMPTVLKAIKA